MKKLLFGFGILAMVLVATTMTSCGEAEATDEKTEISEGDACCESEECSCKEDGKDCSKGDTCEGCKDGGKSCSKDSKCSKGDHKCSKADMQACKKFCTEECKDGEHSEECKTACKAYCDKEGKSCDHKCGDMKCEGGDMKCEDGKCGGADSTATCEGGDMVEPTCEAGE